MNHTPGPWTRDIAHPSAINANKKHVAMVGFYKCADEDMRIDEVEHEANAKLITTTPELLDELERLVLLIRSGEYIHRLQEEIISTQALIARAKGEA